MAPSSLGSLASRSWFAPVSGAAESEAGGEAAVAAPADAGADDTTSSCTAPADPAVVDEHPATVAVTSTNPTVRRFNGLLIA